MDIIGFTLLKILTFVLVIGILIFVHELGHFLAARSVGIKVLEFAFGFKPRLFSWKRGDTRYSINAIPIGGYVRLYGEEGEDSGNKQSFASKTALQRFWVLSAGVMMNFILGIVLISIGFMIGMSPFVTSPKNFNQENTESQILILQVESGSPAEKIGLKSGDVILEANGRKIASTEELQAFTKSNRGKEVEFSIKSDDRIRKEKVTLSTDENKGALGVAPIEETKIKLPFYKAILAGFVETMKTIYFIGKALVFLFKDLIQAHKVSEGVAGPIGIYTITGEVIKLGFIYLLQFVALLTINLGLINFIPFPALDGGRVLILGIEKIRGKKLTPNIENLIHAIGFAILIILILLISFYDIKRRFFIG